MILPWQVVRGEPKRIEISVGSLVYDNAHKPLEASVRHAKAAQERVWMNTGLVPGVGIGLQFPSRAIDRSLCYLLEGSYYSDLYRSPCACIAGGWRFHWQPYRMWHIKCDILVAISSIHAAFTRAATRSLVCCFAYVHAKRDRYLMLSPRLGARTGIILSQGIELGIGLYALPTPWQLIAYCAIPLC